MNPDEILRQEFSAEFVRAMQARTLQGFHTYGPCRGNAAKVDLLKTARQRIAKYEQDGNTESLVDAANFLMFEFMYPSHPDAHFRAAPSEESPGVTMANGRRWRGLRDP